MRNETRFGVVNPNQTLENSRIFGVGTVYYNLSTPTLVELSVRRGEGTVGPGGSLLVSTGKCTGRSPDDKFIVEEPLVADGVCWEGNSAMPVDDFEILRRDMFEHLRGRDCVVQDLHCGADPAYRINVRVIASLAWHGLFIRHMLRVVEAADLKAVVPDCTVIACPEFKADPSRHGCNSDVVVAMSVERRMILIAGTGYAGEIKKSIFSYLNYTLPGLGVMPMHCSANHASGDPNDVAVFFGLSGTGKTTLSADPQRTLIGDDEHGWSDNGIFNMEGGSYAKTLHLDPVAEPEIHAATRMFATVIENMVCDPDTREPDFDDDSITANMRCAYPLKYIANASATGLAGQPRHIVMLTCDAFGVLPPIARLTPAQAVYHFLSGFTSKTAGTERGVREPQPTFSACFGAPFMPRRPDVYGRLLGNRIAASGASCWLVNTGWTGGAYGEGSRLTIGTTRRLLSLALDGTLERAAYRKDDKFRFDVPESVAGIDDKLLRPRDTWADAAAFDRQTAKLLRMFSDNFAKYDGCVGRDVLAEQLVAC